METCWFGWHSNANLGDSHQGPHLVQHQAERSWNGELQVPRQTWKEEFQFQLNLPILDTTPAGPSQSWGTSTSLH